MQLAERELHSGMARLLLDYIKAQEIHDDDLVNLLQKCVADNQMNHAQWWSSLNAIQQHLPQQRVGFEIGLCIKPSHLGVLGYLMLTSASLAELLQRFQRFIGLLHQSDGIAVSLHDGNLSIRWATEFGPTPRISDEVYIAAILQFLRICTAQKDITFRRLQFIYPEPETISDYVDLFRCPLSFGNPCNELTLPLSVLALPLNHADPALNSLLERQAEALIAAIPQPGNFSSKLRDVLVHRLQDGDISASSIARQLAMSRRTLHRRLSEQGLDFNSVLRNVREQLARQYLGDSSLSLGEISLLLGYSEQSSFTRSFKQWTGYTPLGFRRRTSLEILRA